MSRVLIYAYLQSRSSSSESREHSGSTATFCVDERAISLNLVVVLDGATHPSQLSLNYSGTGFVPESRLKCSDAA